MNSYQITIVEPQAVKLLEDMAKRNLIRLSPVEPQERFKALLAKLRSKKAPTLDQITKEVEAVRTARHLRKNAD
jgi:hypothetical protein